MLLLTVAAFAVIYGRSAQTKAATHTDPMTVEDSDRGQVTLPSGVEVQLVGISKHPSDKERWWKPNGSTASRPDAHLALWGAHEGEIA
jgi:hypothetical protein